MIAVLVTVTAMQIVSPSGVLANVLSNNNQPAGTIYWSTVSEIFRANTDGSNATTIVDGLSSVWDITTDIDGGKIYWADSGTGKIQRANLDGSEVEDVVVGLAKPFGLALDVEAGKVYWTNSTFLARRTALNRNEPRKVGKIQRANLDGTEVEDLVTERGQPSAIALDTKAGRMYWTEFTAPGSVVSANLDGTERKSVALRVGWALGVAVDSENGKVYWASNFTRIERSNLDGTEREFVIDKGSGTGLAALMDLDVAGNKIYFAHLGPDSNNDLTVWSIQKANLDGSQSRTIIPNPGPVSGMALGL